MSKETLLVELEDGETLSRTMSPQGVEDLWSDLLEYHPEIKGLVIEVEEEHKLPSMYEETEVDRVLDSEE